MTTPATVTIGMPVFNGERFLSDAIESILAQTHGDLSLRISDNASTDATREICAGFAARDRRITYSRSDRNRGAAWNYNRVFDGSSSRYFKWAAHDDYLAPDFLARCVAVLDRDPGVVVCFTDTLIVDADRRPLHKLDYSLDLTDENRSARWRAFQGYFSQLRNFHCNPVFALMRADSLARTRLIGAYWASDVVLLGELALRGKFEHVREELFFRRDHADRAMTANKSLAAMAAWYDPDGKIAPLFPRWRCFAEHFKSISRVRMPVRQRVACVSALLRATRWRGMARDLRSARARARAGSAGGMQVQGTN